MSTSLKRERVIDLMRSKGLRRSFVAKQCGIETQTFNRYLMKKNPCNPSASVAKLLAITLSTTVDEITVATRPVGKFNSSNVNKRQRKA